MVATTRLRTSTPFDIGDPDAPVGSPAWCLAVHTSMCRLKHSAESTVAELQVSLTNFQQRQYFTRLGDRDGVTFATWEDFIQYPEPYGLGMRAEVVAAIMTERDKRKLLRDVVDAVPKLAQHGGKRNEQADNISLPIHGTSAAYLIAKLKRDAPEYAERLAAGEFRSARAAALAAGIIKPTPVLVLLRRAWKHASDDERVTFLREVT
jgi:hypothetical protein